MPKYIQPFGFIVVRCIGALILFWLSSTLFIKEKTDRKDIPRFMLVAIFGIAINQTMFLKGLSITTPINASILMIASPIIVMTITTLVLKEKLSWNKTAGISLGVVGVMLLITKPDFSTLQATQNSSFTKDTLSGDVFILINALSWGLYLVYVKGLMQKYNTFTIMKWMFLFGLLYVLPYSYEEFSAIEWSAFTPDIWWKTAFVVIGVTFFTYLLNTYALRSLSPTIAGIYIYLQPFFASLIAIYSGKDKLDMIKVIAAVLIAAGVYLVSKPTLSKTKSL